MQVRVFEAPDMASGLKKVKETFGPDALILSTKTIRQGKLGLMSKPVLEITAAIDTSWKPSKPPKNKRRSAQQYAPRPTVPKESLSYEKLWKEDESLITSDSTSTAPLDKGVQDELGELRGIIKTLSRQIAELQPDRQPVPPPYREPLSSDTGQEDDQIIQLLQTYDVNLAAAGRAAWYARESLGYTSRTSPSPIRSLAGAAIAHMMTTEKVLQQKAPCQQRLSLIGPTGVGKTTTIAKLAANYLCRFGGKIALITIDTFRIAAVEQLKVYGEIMGLPVAVVLKPEELEQALARFEHYDLILIDTAGRSPSNRQELEDMAAFMRPRFNIQHHLVLSATTREREIQDIIKQFSILPIKTFIFSKVDECERLGVILNTHIHNNTPISFLTNGQRVPEDIISPNPKVMADYIMNDHRTQKNG
ncbi:MAG: flagellar biosynthesis protein FlhF [Desulfobulbus propionicus]|nr:MAG: flagellar biosynthesis protein FlhF [Desulfobulbus propionicus]